VDVIIRPVVLFCNRKPRREYGHTHRERPA